MLITPGTINPLNRPIINNSDGSISTTISFSVNLDGVEVLLPLVINGVKVSQDDAISHYRESGEHLGIFETWQEAERYSRALHGFQVLTLRAQGLLPSGDGLLEPCPFCASTNVENWASRPPKKDHDIWCVFCHDCSCEGPEALTEAEAARLWNTRAVI